MANRERERRAYAAETKVSTESSRAEIERTLRSYKADGFGYAEDGVKVSIFFRMASRHIRLNLTMPEREQPAFTEYRRGSMTFRRADSEIDKHWLQACRQRWRVLALMVRAKLEAVEAGVTTVEDEFLASTMMPDGATVGESVKRQIDEAYRLGGMPRPLMITGSGR
ncbi:MAG TPA: hypothetical protein VGG68_00845 [Caulobacteraceae bacterium]|jgi:hypothetical protein